MNIPDRLLRLISRRRCDAAATGPGLSPEVDAWERACMRAGDKLAQLGEGTEDDFLALGRDLQSFYTRAQAMGALSRAVVEIMTGQEVQTAGADLHATLAELDAYLSESSSQFARMSSVFSEHATALKKITAGLESFQMLSLNLSILGFLTRVENAHIDENMQSGFGALTDDVKKLSASIKLRNRMHRTLLEFYGLAKLPTPVVTGREIMLVSDYMKFTFDFEASIALVAELTRKLAGNYREGERRVDPSARRILITGCPMGKSLEKVADAIESPETNGVIVGFENCGNLKCSFETVDENRDPIEAIAEKYLNIPCSVMSPNKGRMELIRRFVGEYRAEGVVDVILQACHTYSVESHSVREGLQEMGIPYMAIETDYSQGDVGQLATRFGAFVEML